MLLVFYYYSFVIIQSKIYKLSFLTFFMKLYIHALIIAIGCSSSSIDTLLPYHSPIYSYSVISSSSSAFSFVDVNPTSKTYKQDIFLEKHLDLDSIVILNFFEPWCQPCMEEFIELEKLYREDNIFVIGFTSNYYDYPFASKEQNPNVYNNWIPIENRVSYPFIDVAQQYDKVMQFVSSISPDIVNRDSERETGESFLNSGLPTTIVLYSGDPSLVVNTCIFSGSKSYESFSDVTIENSPFCFEDEKWN